MNVHPLLVHFPIALLTVYALCEIVPYKRLTSQAYWFYVKAVLSIVGAVSSYAAYLAGDAIEDMFRGNAKLADLVEVHSTWASVSVVIFSLLAASYLIGWVRRSALGDTLKKAQPGLMGLLTGLEGFVLKPVVAGLLALGGLVAITVTGALGGSIVYGPDIDPFVRFIYDLVV